MKKILSVMLAAAMVVSAIVCTPIKTSANSVDIDTAQEVKVSDTKNISENVEIKSVGDIILYKVTIEKEGGYTFYTEGSLDTQGYLLDESQLETYNSYHCIKYDDDHGAGSNCKLKYYFSEGEVVYFAINEYRNDSTGNIEVHIDYNEGYVYKDGIFYEKNYVSADEYTWSVDGYKDVSIKKAVIASEIEGAKVTDINKNAFQDAYELTEVVIPEGIINIMEYAFSYTDLTEITIPESCEYIGTFYGTKIKEINIPKNVQKIGYLHIDELEKITVSKDNLYYCDIDGVLYTKDKTNLVQCPRTKESDIYEVAEGTEKIESYAFYLASKIGKVVLPDSVKLIGDYAFYQSEICQIDCGARLETIGYYAFYGCENLKLIDLPASVKSIRRNAFSGIDDISLVIRNSECSLGSDIVSSDSLSTIYGVKDSTAQGYAADKDYITFIEINKLGCESEPKEHQWGSFYIKAPTCEEDGIIKDVCINCGEESQEKTAEKLEHLEVTAHYCNRCEKIIDKDTIKYATFESEVSVSEKDFGEYAESTFYGFDIKKAGTYVISVSKQGAVDYGIFFGIERTDGKLEAINMQDDMEVTLKEGESLWAVVYYYLSEDETAEGCKLGISCKHTNTEIKTTPSTCQKEGKKEEVCASCGKVIVKTEVIGKKSHEFGKNNSKCSVCGVANPNYKAGNDQPADLNNADLPNTIKDGNYTYSLNKDGEYVSVKANKSAIKKLKKGKKAFNVKWKKVANVSGYQIQYSTSRKFKKKVTKIKSYKGNKKFTRKINKLKSNKKYYVRIRTYKVVQLNGKNVNLYSDWSKAKSVKTK